MQKVWEIMPKGGAKWATFSAKAAPKGYDPECRRATKSRPGRDFAPQTIQEHILIDFGSIFLRFWMISEGFCTNMKRFFDDLPIYFGVFFYRIQRLSTFGRTTPTNNKKGFVAVPAAFTGGLSAHGRVRSRPVSWGLPFLQPRARRPRAHDPRSTAHDAYQQ